MRSPLYFVLCLASLCFACLATAQPVTNKAISPLHPGLIEQVNTVVFDGHSEASVAFSEDGTNVVCWQQGFPADIYARIYNGHGTPLGSEFLVNTFTSGAQFTPEVAIDSAGNFVIVWVSQPQDGSLGGIYGQRFNRLGTPQGSEFQINFETLGHQNSPKISMAPDGTFVVVWDTGSYGTGPNQISARLLLGDGSALTGELNVADSEFVSLLEADVARFGNGGFVVTWHDGDGPGPGSGSIQARRYDATGQSITAQFLVNQATTAAPQRPVTFANADGSFGIVWEEISAAYDTSSIVGQLYDNSGTAVLQQLDVFTSPCPPAFDINLDVDADAEGNFVVLWQSACPLRELFTQHFLPGGTPLAAAITVGAFEDGFIALDVRPDGGHIQVWHEYFSGIKSQRFDTDCDSNGIADLVDIASGTYPDLNLNGTPDDCEASNLPPLVVIADIAPIVQNTGPISLSAQFSRTQGLTPTSTLWSKVSGPGPVKFSDFEGTETDVLLNTAGTYLLRYTVTTSADQGSGVTSIVIPPAVSAYGLTPPASPWEPLTLPREDDAAIAADYYQALDPFGAKLNFDEWKLFHGFPDTIDAVSVAAGTGCCTGATFFNAADLGFGRRMIMKPSGFGHAFSVTNYATVEDAAADVNPVATVSMDWGVDALNNQYITGFYIFQDLDQDGVQERVPSVDLDGNGPKFLPGLCISCHGGNITPAVYRQTGQTNASFLPFDINGFEFSTEPGLRQEDQEAAFKEFNAAVLQTATTPAIDDLIYGWYGGQSLPNDTQNNDYIPSGWLCSPTDGAAYTSEDLQSLYLEVIAPSCRVCHSGQLGLWDLMEAADYRDLNSTDPVRLTDRGVFIRGSMPHAKVTYDRFWNSTLPHQPDIVRKALDSFHGAVDCVSAVEEPSQGRLPLVSRITNIYPNPFNPQTVIRFETKASGSVKLRVYDLQGRLVRVLDQDNLAPGQYKATWRGLDEAGKSVASGAYLVRLELGSEISTRRITMLK
jgi:hypothetical protein